MIDDAMAAGVGRMQGSVPVPGSLEALVRGIDFPYVPPEAYFPHEMGHAVVSQALGRLGLSFDLFNTRFADDAVGAVPPVLYDLCKLPRASTIAIGRIIHEAVRRMPSEQAFVNVGVWHGFTFLSGLADNPDKRCIGVDRFCIADKIGPDGGPRFRGAARLVHRVNDQLARRAFLRRFARHRTAQHTFHEMDYAAYFARTHQGPIGFYIYDAQHRYRDQLRGLELAEPFFAPGCVVLIDDTNDADNRRATLDFIDASPHRYDMLLDVRTASNRHPTFWNGLMLFRKVG